jgi:hypothetical protein
MTDDLVKRLRSLAEEEFEMLNNVHEPVQEAADRIEKLEAALRYYAEYLPTFSQQDFRSVARAALGEKKNG